MKNKNKNKVASYDGTVDKKSSPLQLNNLHNNKILPTENDNSSANDNVPLLGGADNSLLKIM